MGMLNITYICMWVRVVFYLILLFCEIMKACLLYKDMVPILQEVYNTLMSF